MIKSRYLLEVYSALVVASGELAIGYGILIVSSNRSLL
jgi:hypothetical protein